MSEIANPRRFAVHARCQDRHHAGLVEERSFEAAAIAWLEGAVFEADGPEVSIIVRDVESGREHCFRIDLETGEAAAGC